MSVMASLWITTHDTGREATTLPNLRPERRAVGEEERRFPSVHHDVGNLARLGVALDVVPIARCLHPSEHRAVRLPASPEVQGYGQRDRDHDSLEHPEDDHAEAGDHGERECALAHLPIPHQRAQIEQRQGGADEHRGKRRLRQVRQQRIEEQEKDGDDAGADHRGELTLRSGLLDHGRA